MKVMSTPVFCLNSSMVSVGEVPRPDEPKEYLPGSFFAAAISFCSVLCSKLGWQHSRLGCVPIQATVSRSVTAL